MYEPESIVCVRVASVTAKEMVLAVAPAYVVSAAMEEPIVHVPAVTNATSPELELMVQILGVVLE